MDIIKKEGEPYLTGTWLVNLGGVYRDLGQVEKAIGYLEESLAIFVAIKSPNADLVRGWLETLRGEGE